MAHRIGDPQALQRAHHQGRVRIQIFHQKYFLHMRDMLWLGGMEFLLKNASHGRTTRKKRTPTEFVPSSNSKWPFASLKAAPISLHPTRSEEDWIVYVIPASPLPVRWAWLLRNAMEMILMRPALLTVSRPVRISAE